MKKVVTTQITLHKCKNLPKTVEDVNKFLIDLVDFIGMRVIPENLIGQNNPHSFYFDPPAMALSNIESGITGIVILIESHAAIHTWNYDELIIIVVTSCKPYNRIETAKFCSMYFDSSHILYE